MRKLKYIPKSCVEQVVPPAESGGAETLVPKTFEGHIMVRIPNVLERLDLASCIVTMQAGGELLTKQGADIQKTKSIISESIKFYEEVSLKRLSDGAEFKSFDDLSYDSDCDQIISEVAVLLANGIRPPKN